MFNIGNMMPEIVESVHMNLEDYPDIETDCMLYLSKISPTKDYSAIASWFKEHNRCEECGMPLITVHYREPHHEFNPVEYEDMYEQICPQCDFNGEGEIVE